MVLPALLGVAWPAAASFGPGYWLASGVALVGTIWFMVFLKRTADEHYRLLKEEEEKKRSS